MTKRTNTGTHPQTNTNKQHQINKIFQYRAKRKKKRKEEGRVEEKYKIHQAVVEDRRSRH